MHISPRHPLSKILPLILLSASTASAQQAVDATFGRFEPFGQLAVELDGKPLEGIWCPTCARFLPWLMQVEKELEGSSIRFEYYGLPRSMDDPEAKAAGIRAVPTAVVSVGGKELGRRSSQGLGVPEKALAEILGRS